MKDLISRIKKINWTKSNGQAGTSRNSVKGLIGNFVLSYELDDSEEKLQFIIEDNSPVVNKKKDLLARRLFIKFNNQNPEAIVMPVGDIIVQPKDNPTKAIYQFNINYDDFSEGRNTIGFYENESDKANKQSGILTTLIEEDTIHQDDGGDIKLVLLAALELTALSEKNLVNVQLNRPDIQETTDKILWKAIKSHSLNFTEYEHFIDTVICKDFKDSKKIPPANNLTTANHQRDRYKSRSPFIRSEEYNLIKFATDFYMLKKFGLNETELLGYVGSSGKLPYYDLVIDRIRDDLKFDNLNSQYEGGNDCDVSEEQRLFNPFMIELIWSYWMEQGMLVQTLNVINLRFQNIKGNNYVDRLQRFDADPLRPLSYILWGYIQDEQHRLSMPRRLNEYDHEYGLILTGRAVPRMNPVDTRVKFLEAFHSLLTLCTIYFKESDDTTRIADAFPILNALKEVHLLLAEGNHNAYGNLTWTARQEMMMQQYVLARPEMREFLGGRTMVPYAETWMDRVDTMRNLQGWGGTGITHFYELAVHGELVILSIRYGNWSDVKLDSHNAANWAQEFRNNIQRYIHAYRSVTSVDLAVEQVIQLPNTFAVQPSFLIQQKLLLEERRRRA